MSQFEVRCVPGWISDFSTTARLERWPSISLDHQLMHDLDEAFELAQIAGYTHMTLWGLLSSRRWMPNLEDTADAERRRRVDAVIEAAHRRGLKVLYGVGLYSWGFEAIIEHDPRVDGGSPITMCASRPRAHEWMEAVIDYIFEHVAVDGVAMQSSDQGRCPCDLCSRMSAIEYHAFVNARTTAYVRSRFPGKMVYINTWGMDLSNPDDLPHVTHMAEGADVLLDYNNSSARRDPAYRKTLVSSLDAAFGTLQGWWVDPPPFWDGLKYFIPLTVRNVPYHQGLLADGARAVEHYIQPLNNAGGRVNFLFDGFMLADPTRDPQTTLEDVIDMVYAPKSSAAREVVKDVFRSAEDVFLANNRNGREPQRIVPTAYQYAIREPQYPGFDRPQYLLRMPRAGVQAYCAVLQSGLERLYRERGNFGEARPFETLERCILNTIADAHWVLGVRLDDPE